MISERIWPNVSCGAAALLAVTIGYLLLAIPIQTSDSFVHILPLERSFMEVFWDGIQGGYIRPTLWTTLKAVRDLSPEALFYAFRWTHVVQVVLLMVLFAALARPRTASAGVALLLALAVLVGHHTFTWTVREAYPINHFLTIVVCCAMAACLAFGAHRWWTDLAAVALFAFAATTIETGLLIGGIFVAGYLLGLRGVSRTGVVMIGVLIAGYFVFRFTYLDIATPALNLRETGFGFRRYDGAEVEAMFTGREYVLYSYNVAVSIVGTLLGEPRDGLFRVTRGIVTGDIDVTLIVGVVSSTLATAVIARYIWLRRATWRRLEFQRDDQIVILFVLVLLANSAISYAYTKDVIMSPAGFFYAAAFFVACRDFIDALTVRSHMPGVGRTAQAVGLAVMLILSTTWSIRAVGLHAALTQSAYKERELWAYMDEFVERLYNPVPPNDEALKTQLQTDAVITRPQRPELREAFTMLFEMD
jgi:hypothetical protein